MRTRSSVIRLSFVNYSPWRGEFRFSGEAGPPGGDPWKDPLRGESVSVEPVKSPNRAKSPALALGPDRGC